MKPVKIIQAELIEGWEAGETKYSRAFFSLPVQLLIIQFVLLLMLL